MYGVQSSALLGMTVDFFKYKGCLTAYSSSINW